MNEENLNLEIRKFLKKIGIKSQQIIDQEIKNALNEGKLSVGSEVNLEMTLSIHSDLDITPAEISFSWYELFTETWLTMVLYIIGCVEDGSSASLCPFLL